MKKILFVASECVPFIKTGGLADVVGTLPKYFDKEKFDCRVIIPKYTCIPDKFKDQMTFITSFYMNYQYRDCYVGLYEMDYQGVKFYFVDNEDYFSGFGPYTDMKFDLEKFAFFSKAVLAALPILDFQPDILHCHDWQAGLVPVHIHDQFAANPFYWDMKSIMTIHNLKFQGVWDINTIKRYSELSDYYFTSDKLEAYKNGNMLKGGLVYADKITTVSNTYAEEIKTEYYGEGLDGLMRARSNNLVGILNGIDYEAYDPANDPMLPHAYDVENFRKEKAKNKAALQKELGLTVDPKAFMVGVVSRLTDQKGFDLVNAVMDELCAEDVQLVVLGTGEKAYEEMFKHYAWKYPERVSANLKYSEELSKKIYGSCDAFLMPSRFEPCGLSQLMALRYGTLPIVRETGGLKDTVEAYNEFAHTGTGFSFTNYNAHEMLKIFNYAKSVYQNNKRDWNKLVENAMKADFSWNASAKKYEDLYENM